MFKRAQEDTSGRWAAFHFTSHDNPYISQEALQDITSDMTALAYRQEILAEDIEDVPGALWTRALVESALIDKHPDLSRVVIGVDPPGGATECGIVAAGSAMVDGKLHGFVLADYSLRASPNAWAGKVLTAYNEQQADRVVGEANYGGDMVESTINQAAKDRGQFVAYQNVHATRGKAVRAEPIVAMYEQGRIHHVGAFPYLEEEMCTWIPGETRESPNRVDAMVWALTEVMQGHSRGIWFPGD
jgi:phage terminase large subunit-like protein